MRFNTHIHIHLYICIFRMVFPRILCLNRSVNLLRLAFLCARSLPAYPCVYECAWLRLTKMLLIFYFFLVSLSYRHAFQFSTVRMIEDTRSCESITAPS